VGNLLTLFFQKKAFCTWEKGEKHAEKQKTGEKACTI